MSWAGLAGIAVAGSSEQFDHDLPRIGCDAAGLRGSTRGGRWHGPSAAGRGSSPATAAVSMDGEALVLPLPVALACLGSLPLSTPVTLFRLRTISSGCCWRWVSPSLRSSSWRIPSGTRGSWPVPASKRIARGTPDRTIAQLVDIRDCEPRMRQRRNTLMDAKCLKDKHRWRRGTSLRTRVLSGMVVSNYAVTLSAASPSSATTPGSSTSPTSAANGTGQWASNSAAPSASSGCPSAGLLFSSRRGRGGSEDQVSAVEPDSPATRRSERSPCPTRRELWDARHRRVVADVRTLHVRLRAGHVQIVLLGESHAWMWSIPIESIAESHGDSFALLYHSACNVMPTAGSLPVQGAVGQAPSGAQCAQWTKAAISWINAYKPQVVILTTVGGFDASPAGIDVSRGVA